MCTIVTIPPVNCPDEHDQENVRHEFMQSGFDQVSKARYKNEERGWGRLNFN